MDRDMDQTAANPRRILTDHDVEAERLADWRVFFSVLHGRFATGDFATGVELVRQVGEAAEKANHHPDVDLSYGFVEVRLTSHDVDGVTSRDIALARAIGDIAGSLGATAQPERTSRLEIGLDTVDADAVRPFWAALLGYVETERPDEVVVVDPDGRGPTLWFQQTDGDTPSETPAQRYHFDLRLPPEQVESRIEEALAAGGTLVSDADAPAFWVLADAQSNRCCLTTCRGRDGD